MTELQIAITIGISIVVALIVVFVAIHREWDHGYRVGRDRGKAEANLEWSTARLQECVTAMERLEQYLRSKAPDGDEIKLSETVTRADLLAANMDLQSLTPRRDWDPTGKARVIIDRLIEQAIKDQETP
jgi:hypothetical protein